jgi:ABC-2 type transport system permease protein
MSQMTYAIQPPRASHYRVKNVLKSEVAKTFTLRSTALTLGLSLVASLLVTVLVCKNQGHPAGGFQDFDPTENSLTGMVVAALFLGVFGVMLVTSEYSSGTIRSTLAATPRRPLVLATKAAVMAGITVVFCEVLSLLNFFVGQAFLSSAGTPTATLSSPGAFRAIFLTGLFVALLAVMSFGFGLIFRNTAASIAAFAGVVFVAPLVVHQISQSAVRFVPSNILVNSIMSTVSQGQGPYLPLSPGLGLVVMVVYTAIALAIGAAVFMRRDA